MSLLIDGYNLMHAAGIVGPGRGPGGLERSRAALIRFVAASLGEAERRRAVIVFDSAGAPPGLPGTLLAEGLTIRFAKGYADADELLEELIAADHSPRQLTVVSSDHRVQRAATRRRATAVDSDQWFKQMRRRRQQAREPDEKPGAPGDKGQAGKSPRRRSPPIGPAPKGPPPRVKVDVPGEAKPGPIADDAEVRFWLQRIVDDRETAGDKWGDIFPPGYAEKLADDEA